MPKDENGNIGLKEFQSYMLIKMGYVDELTLQMISECFTAMDADGSGQLSVDDIVSSEEGEAFLRYMRVRYGIGPGDSLVMPLGLFGLRTTFSQQVPEMSEEEHRKYIAKIRAKANKNA